MNKNPNTKKRLTIGLLLSQLEESCQSLIWPGITALALLFVVAFWAILLGIGEVGGAFTMRKRDSHMWGWTLAAGLLNLIFGIALLVWPANGILALVWLVGIFALVGGVTLIILALRVRQGQRALAHLAQTG